MPAPYVTGAAPDLNQTLDTARALDRHLEAAISEFSPTKGKTMSNGLKRLKSFSETLRASLDAEADKAAVALQAAHDEAVQAAHDVRDKIGGEFKSAASEVQDMLNQITNG